MSHLTSDSGVDCELADTAQTLGQHLLILAAMTLHWGHETDAAVTGVRGCTRG
jgi:hypothetical protein